MKFGTLTFFFEIERELENTENGDLGELEGLGIFSN